MKFDKIIMNPPYVKSLHLQILSQAMKHADETVNLSPINWLQDPLAEYKSKSKWNKFKNIREKIADLEVVPAHKAEKLFGATFGVDLGIYHITKDGGWKDFIEKKIVQKCFSKMTLVNIDSNKKNGWRVRVARISNSNHRTGEPNSLGKLLYFKDGMKDGRFWYEFYQKNKWSKTTPEITNSIHFGTEEEAVNFIKSVEETKFGKWYEAHAISNVGIDKENILWLGDYTHPWTDEMLYDYFDLTKEEREIIENTF